MTADQGHRMRSAAKKTIHPAESDQLAQLVASLGEESFPARFLEAAYHVFAADQVVVFEIAQSMDLRIVLAESRLSGHAAVSSLATAYVEHHRDADPAIERAGADTAQPQPIAHVVHAHDIADADYRNALFDTPGLRGKLSLLLKQNGGKILYLNFYRSINQDPFSLAEAATLERIAPLIVALLHKHDTLRSNDPSRKRNIARFVDSICAARNAHLSQREHMVCTLILAGLSMEGISLEMNLSPHSVTSYRRRAFEKLGISTQKELFTLALNTRIDSPTRQNGS